MVYPIFKRTIGFYFHLYLKKTNGIENFPKNVPFIIASNHESHFDSFLLSISVISKLNKKLYFLTRFGSRDGSTGLFSKITLFIARPLFVNWLGCIPVLKKGGAVDACIALLKKGKTVGVYPEGKRNPTKTLLTARTGVAAMALLSKVPVVPAGIIDSHKIFPIGAIIPRFRRAIINIGKPMYFDKYYGKANNKKVLEKVTNKIMIEIGKLCRKKYPKR